MNGLYIGSMGMMNYMRRINVHSNNVANAQTTGFKAENMTSKVFDVQDTYRRRWGGNKYRFGRLRCSTSATHVNLVQGNIQMTNSATDFFLDDGGRYNIIFVTSKMMKRF